MMLSIRGLYQILAYVYEIIIVYNIKSLMVVPFMKLKSRTEILVPFAAIQAVPIAVIAWYRLQRYAWYRYSAIVIVPLIYVPR